VAIFVFLNIKKKCWSDMNLL